LEIRILGDVMLCRWGSSYRRFEAS